MKEFEEDDPMQIEAITFPEGDSEIQARCIIEEFFSMGMPQENLIDLFRNPFYVGSHQLYQKLGEESVLRLIRECGVGVFSAKISNYSATKAQRHKGET